MKKNPTRRKRPAKPKPRPLFFATRHVPMFSGRFGVFVANTMQEAEEEACRRFLKRPSSYPSGARHDAGCLDHRGRVAVMLVRGKITHEIINHEIRHATNNVLEYCGVEPSHRNDEAAAYLSGRLAGWLYLRLDRAGEKVNLDDG